MPHFFEHLQIVFYDCSKVFPLLQVNSLLWYYISVCFVVVWSLLDSCSWALITAQDFLILFVFCFDFICLLFCSLGWTFLCCTALCCGDSAGLDVDKVTAISVTALDRPCLKSFQLIHDGDYWFKFPILLNIFFYSNYTMFNYSISHSSSLSNSIFFFHLLINYFILYIPEYFVHLKVFTYKPLPCVVSLSHL